jgi:integrase
MGRPPNPIGTTGRIRAWQTPAGWAARTTVRDPDGRTREVQRTGRTRAAAERALKEAVRDRSHARGMQLSPDDRVKEAATRWRADPERKALAPYTWEQYRRVLDVHIVTTDPKPCRTPTCGEVHSGIGELRIRELTVGTCSTFLRGVEARHGSSTARTVRSVLSGIGQWCAVRDLLPANPVRDSGRISTKPKHPPVALTLAEAIDLLMWSEYHDLSIARDLPDFVAWMMATGLRIGEAAAGRPEDLDLDRGIFWVTGNLVRIKGAGILRQEDENHKLNPRGLELPSWAVAMLEERLRLQPVAAGRPLFPAPLGGWRDPSNTQADIRELLEFAGYTWVRSHTFRKTVATLMDQAGLSARAGADQLGHRNPSMTQDKYWSRRRVASTGAAAVLEQLRSHGRAPR